MLHTNLLICMIIPGKHWADFLVRSDPEADSIQLRHRVFCPGSSDSFSKVLVKSKLQDSLIGRRI